jgi:hypothetical protein
MVGKHRDVVKVGVLQEGRIRTHRYLRALPESIVGGAIDVIHDDVMDAVALAVAWYATGVSAIAVFM